MTEAPTVNSGRQLREWHVATLLLWPRFLAMAELAAIFTPGTDDPFPLVYRDISYVRQECASLALQIEKAR